MRFSNLLLLSSALATAVLASPQLPNPNRLPLRWGILAYPTFVGLDAFAPIEILNIVRMLTSNMSIAIVGETMDPVPSHAISDLGTPATYLRPTHTIYDNIALDVLLVPGGGPESAVQFNNTRLINYVKRVYPSLQHILSTCTGAQFLAKAGVLDGKKATTSKFSWKEITKTGPRVKWVPCARWVRDGNVWTSSGVTSGFDLTNAFVEQAMRNATLANLATNIIEYETHEDPSWDPFCQIWNVTAS